LKNGKTEASANSTSIFANNTELTSRALKADYYVTKKVEISTLVASALSGSTIAAAISYSLRIFIYMSK